MHFHMLYYKSEGSRTRKDKAKILPQAETLSVVALLSLEKE